MRRIAIFFVVICLVSAWYTTAQFTQKREKKGPSLATLKEDCCQEFGEILKLVPDCLRKISDVQDLSVAAIQGYWQGDKTSFCGCASRQKLTACNERLHALKQKVEATLREFDLCIAELRKENSVN